MFCHIVVAFCRIGTANRIVGLLAFGCASLLRLLGKLKQSANSAGNRILGDLRFGDLAELLEALVHVIDAQLAGLTEVLRQDPRRAGSKHEPTRVYHLAYAGLDVAFTVDGDVLHVVCVS